MTYRPAFEEAISEARHAPFRAVAADDDHAWALYAWNVELLAAWTLVLHLLEVTFRNSVHEALTQLCGQPNW